MTAVPTYALSLSNGKLTKVETPDLSAAFRDRTTDTLYVTDGNGLEGLFTSTGRAAATWTKRITLPEYTAFGWLAVQSDFLDADGSSASVTVTIASEAGALLSTSVVSSRTPVRLPAFREREIVVSVTSAARVTAVTLACTSDELKQVP